MTKREKQEREQLRKEIQMLRKKLDGKFIRTSNGIQKAENQQEAHNGTKTN